MKTYDSFSVKNALLERLQANQDWKAITGNSVINAILDQFAEALSEQARYTEMLFLESKWDTSQDSKQVASLANIIGYKPRRKISAAGTIYLSDSNLIHEVGKTISVKDFLNNENLPWSTATSKVDVSSNATILDDQGNSYIFTSVNSLNAGSYYTTNTIIEGIKKSIKIPSSVVAQTATKSILNPYIYVPIKVTNMEDAQRPQTSSFFKVLLNGTKEYRVVDSLLLSTSRDRDVEIIEDLYERDVYYLKFNANPDKGEVLNYSKASSFDYIEVQYVESKGAEGNISSAFQRFSIITSDNKQLFGLSIDPISGGKDEESIADIKVNAPKYYLKTYTTATKEAYEEAIKKIDFGAQTFASNVRVFPGKNDSGDAIVAVSLISPELDDKLIENEITEEKINNIMNLSLSNFKAPSDNLMYKSPNYERFALGVDTTISRGAIDSTDVLSTKIQNAINNLYGSESDLDFGKDFFTADIVTIIKDIEPSVLSINMEVEVNDRTDWKKATRQSPKGDTIADVKTIRIPFDFSKIFKGSRYDFKSYQTGADYGVRVDFFVKGGMNITTTYHSTLICKEDKTRDNESFVLIYDNNNIWHTGNDLDISHLDYSFLNESDEIASDVDSIPMNYLKQYPLIKKVLTDDDYNDIELNQAQLVQGEPGYISDILIYFEGDNDVIDRIGTGYIEMGIDSVYNTLQIYALKDPILRDLLTQYPLANLKCSTNEDDINNFIKDVLSKYVEIYVSLRLYEEDLYINDQSHDPFAVIYIETKDPSSTTTNLTDVKLNRFLNVRCDTV